MLKRTLAAIAAICLALPASASSIDMGFTSFYSLGDSLSDDGKLGTLAPPSLGGRFSNGPVWTELLADSFAANGKFTANFALGGATAGDVNANTYPPALQPLATFMGQVGVMSSYVGAAGTNPLVSALFGANDLFQSFGATGTADGKAVANSVTDGIRAVAALGGNFNNFLVSNLPDIADNPGFFGNPAAGALSAASAEFNTQLAANLIDLENEGLNIFFLDFTDFIDELRPRAAALGLTNLTEACTPSMSTFTPLDNCAVSVDSNGGLVVDLSEADSYFFADSVHPNRIVHQEFAEYAAARVSVAAVPLPAGLPLLLGAIAALGLTRRTLRVA